MFTELRINSPNAIICSFFISTSDKRDYVLVRQRKAPTLRHAAQRLREWTEQLLQTQGWVVLEPQQMRKAQVRRCDSQAVLPWAPDRIEMVCWLAGTEARLCCPRHTLHSQSKSGHEVFRRPLARADEMSSLGCVGIGLAQTRADVWLA